MNKGLLKICLFLIFVSLFVTIRLSYAEVVVAYWKVYSNEKWGYKLKYPEGWYVEEETPAITVIRDMPTLNYSRTSQISITVFLNKKELPSPYFPPGVKVVTEEVTVGGIKGKRYLLLDPISKKGKAVWLLVERNGRFYEFILNKKSSDVTKIFEQIIKSFEFTETENKSHFSTLSYQGSSYYALKCPEECPEECPCKVTPENSSCCCCAVPQYCGKNPSLDELCKTFERAGLDQLGSDGPSLPKIWSGCPEKIRREFGLPHSSCPTAQKISPYVPPDLLKIIAYVEQRGSSPYRQFYYDDGKTIVSSNCDCGYGIMQITSWMKYQYPEPDDFDRDKVSSDWKYNIGTGALFLIKKWNSVPYYIGENDPYNLEDWYYAVWSYNSFTKKNNPTNNHFLPSRPPADGPNFAPSSYRYPYQELVWGYANNPPKKWALWEKKNLKLPDPKLFSQEIPKWIPRPSESLKCPISVGQDAPDPQVFIDAYNVEGRGNMGCPTNSVKSFTNTFYFSAISGYHQDFGNGSTCATIYYVPGYSSSAYSIKLGFYKTFMSSDSLTGEHVYTLLVAPTDREHHSLTTSGAGTDYNWQPFIKGSMYYFIKSHVLDGTQWHDSNYFDGKIVYTWGSISEYYEKEGGRKGALGLPLYNVAYKKYSDWVLWYQWFENGLILLAKNPDYGKWILVYGKETSIFSNNNDWYTLRNWERVE